MHKLLKRAITAKESKQSNGGTNATLGKTSGIATTGFTDKPKASMNISCQDDSTLDHSRDSSPMRSLSQHRSATPTALCIHNTWPASELPWTDLYINPEYDCFSPILPSDQFIAYVQKLKDEKFTSNQEPQSQHKEATSVSQSKPPIPLKSPERLERSAIRDTLSLSPINMPTPLKNVTEMDAITKLEAHWKAMRSTPPGHEHNRFFPLWQSGDMEGHSGSEHPKHKTFTLFDINPFTKMGVKYKKLLNLRDQERASSDSGKATVSATSAALRNEGTKEKTNVKSLFHYIPGWRV